MRPAWVAAALPLLGICAWGQAVACASTPEAAVAAAFAPPSPPTVGDVGYRVQDVQVDALTKRVWARVRRCDDEGAPAVLVPMQASLGSPVAVPTQVGTTVTGLPPVAVSDGALPLTRDRAIVPAARMIAVHAGDAVRVVVNGVSMRMEMQGRAMQQAALDEVVEVELRRMSDEPAHRIVGTLRAGHTVEVQP